MIEFASWIAFGFDCFQLLCQAAPMIELLDHLQVKGRGSTLI